MRTRRQTRRNKALEAHGSSSTLASHTFPPVPPIRLLILQASYAYFQVHACAQPQVGHLSDILQRACARIFLVHTHCTCLRVSKSTHAHTNKHTHKHVHTHCLHAYVRAHQRTRTRTHMHMHIQTTHARTRPRVQPLSLKHMSHATCVRAHFHGKTCSHRNMTQRHTREHTHKYTHTHAC